MRGVEEIPWLYDLSLWVLERLVEIHGSTGECEQAIDYARRWTLLEPAEEAYRLAKAASRTADGAVPSGGQDQGPGR